MTYSGEDRELNKKKDFMKISKKIPFWILVAPIIILFGNQSCLLPLYEWRIEVNQGTIRPDLNYRFYKKIAIPEFEKNLDVEDQAVKKFTSFVRKEFISKKYDVISPEDLNSFLRDSQISIEELRDPGVLKRMRDTMDVQAVIRGKVDFYMVTPQLMAEPSTETDFRKDTKYNLFNLCNIALTIEMVDAGNEKIIWSSSVYTRDGKVMGNPDRLLRKMIKECLETIPKL